MASDDIAEIGIDTEGALFVKPRRETFPRIFLSAMGVEWDSERGRLSSPPPRDWPAQRWFRQILAAVAQEYGVALTLRPDTVWLDIPAALRDEIETEYDRSASEAGQGSGEAGESEHRRFMREQALAEARQLWDSGRYADYVHRLSMHLEELTPSQRMRLDLARKRAGIAGGG